MNKPTLVIGASVNPERYSNKAIHKLLDKGIEVKALGVRSGEVRGVIIETNRLNFENIHTVTLYVNKNIQRDYYDYILSLRPKRVLFNPGTENVEFEALLEKNGITFENACTLVLLGLGQY